MSQKFYENLWIETFQNVSNLLLEKESSLQKTKFPSDVFLEYSISDLYIRYSLAIKCLTACYDQLYNTQKRIFIKRFLDVVSIRLLELKNCLVKLQKNEFNYMDDKLIELFQNPFEFDIESPPFQIVPRAKHLQTKVFQCESLRQIDLNKNDHYGLTEAIIVIQKVERFRQAIQIIEDIKLTQLRVRVLTNQKNNIFDESILNSSAITIQKTWRGYFNRKVFKRLQYRRKILIGLYETDQKTMKTEVNKFLKNKQDQRIQRDLNFEEYNNICSLIETNIFLKKSDDIIEETEDHIRQWLKDWYNIANTFYNYPDEKIGGSLAITNELLITPEEYLIEQQKKSKLKKNKKKKKEKKPKKSDKKKTTDKDIGLLNTEAVSQIKKVRDDILKIWDPLFLSDKINMDLILLEKYHDAHLKLRPKVDERMKIEHLALSEALMKDKKKRKKKQKKPKKLKKKKVKDLTANRSEESLIEELISNDIIKNYQETHLNDFYGDLNFINYHFMNIYKNYTQSLGDVKALIKTICILPLLTNITNRPKSVLLAGPKLSGKHFILNSICTDTSSVLMDISAKNIAGKYPGKSGLKMLVHMINKVSKIVQPTVIFMDQADRPFSKKIPKEERIFEPKRLQKQLFKQIVKKIDSNDRVMLVGLTETPWAAKLKKLSKVYEKIILIPRPDYQSVYLVWKDLLNNTNFVDKNFDFSSLTKISLNYAIPEIIRAVNEIMTPERIIRTQKEPLTIYEIQSFLQNQCTKIDEKSLSRFEKWFKKTRLGKEQTIRLTQTKQPMNKTRRKT